jgi:hypothetical protein
MFQEKVETKSCVYELTHAHSHTYEYNYFLCRFFIMFVVIFNKSKIIKSIEQTLQYNLVIVKPCDYERKLKNNRTFFIFLQINMVK